MEGVLHTILGGANIGVLVLATGAFFVRFFLGERETPLSRGADLTTYAAVAAGLAIAILSALSGYFGTWPREAIQSSLLTQNKILATFALLGAWGLFLLIRWRLGPSMWRRPLVKFWCAFLVIVGFANTILVGSMGGSASLKGTALDPVFWSLNINRYVSLAWGIWVNIAIIVLSLGLMVYAFLRRRRA